MVHLDAYLQVVAQRQELSVQRSFLELLLAQTLMEVHNLIGGVQYCFVDFLRVQRHHLDIELPQVEPGSGRFLQREQLNLHILRRQLFGMPDGLIPFGTAMQMRVILAGEQEQSHIELLLGPKSPTTITGS